MKETAPKLHLIDVDEPLQCFSGLIVRCGLTIAHGEAKWMLSEDFHSMVKIESGDFQRGVCRACIFLEPVGDAKRSMLYGIIDKQPQQSELLEESA